MKDIPAFPRVKTFDGKGYPEDPQDGMTLRDYFAGQAMQSIMDNSPELRFDDVALESYKQADAMLKEREK